MSDTPPPAATSAPPAAQPTFLQRWSRWISVAAGVIIGLTLLLQLLFMFTLPGCGDKRATDTLHAIFRQQKITIDRIRDFKLVSEGESDRTCAAVVEAPGEVANITYRIFWEGWTVKVMIGEVQSKPA